MSYETFIQSAIARKNTVKASTTPELYNSWQVLIQDMPVAMQDEYRLSPTFVVTSTEPLSKTLNDFYAVLQAHPILESTTSMQRYRARLKGSLCAASLQAQAYDHNLSVQAGKLREQMSELQKQMTELQKTRKRCVNFIIVLEHLRKEYADSHELGGVIDFGFSNTDYDE